MIATMFGDLATALALKELGAALAAVDAPYHELPDVKNKDGENINDVKEKRLALVRQHVQRAGDIINLKETINQKAAQAVQAALATNHADVIKDCLKDSGAPPEALEALDKALERMKVPGLEGGCGDPDCDNCNPQKQTAVAKDDERGEFGFGRLIRQMREQKEREAQK